MPKVLNALTDVEAPELSLVRRGAQRKPVAFTKSEEGMPDGTEEILKSIMELELDNEAEVEKVLKASDMSDKGKLAIRSALKVLSAFKEEMPGNVMDTLARLSGNEAPKQFPPTPPKDPKDPKAPVAKVKKNDGDFPYPKPIKKADGRYQFDDDVPEAIRPQLAALWKTQELSEEREKEAIKKAEQLEAVLKQERDERREKEFIKKAEQLPMIPGKDQVKGKLLKSISDASPELGQQVEEIFKTMNEQLANSELLKVKGNPGGAATGSAWEKIQKAAQEIKKDEPKLTIEQARVRVIKAHPELKREFDEERGN